MATQTRRQLECFSDRGEMLRVEAERFASRGENDFADRLLSAMRFHFGWHRETR